MSRTGVSLLELLVVVAVIAILAAVAPLVLPVDRFAVAQSASRFEADLRRARFEAVRVNEVVVFSVDAESDSYTGVAASGRSLVQVTTGSGVGLETTGDIRLRIDPRGVSYFIDGSGDLVPPGQVLTVTFSHPRGASATIEVNGYGQVRRG